MRSPDSGHIPLKDNLSQVNQGYILAKVLYRLHVMGGKNDSGTISFKFEYFTLHQISIDRVKTTERFIENQQFRVMQNGSHKLYFLSHPFRQFFHFFIPPILYFKFLEPGFK